MFNSNIFALVATICNNSRLLCTVTHLSTPVSPYIECFDKVFKSSLDDRAFNATCTQLLPSIIGIV